MGTFPRLRLDPLLQRFVKLAQRLFSLDLFRDVRVGPEPADDLPGFIANGQGTREKPAVAAVATAQQERILPSLAALRGCSNVPA